MNVIIIILLIGLAIFLIIVLCKHLFTKARIKQAFKQGNVIVTGRKGFGKDILFQSVINWRKEKYLSNLNYGGKFQPFNLKDLELTPNTYHNFVKGTIEKCEKNQGFEKTDIYISDAGVYLPSQADYLLHKTYPSLPITYALNRHLYANGIHCNAQRIDRIWKALREQADYFVLMRKRPLKLPFFLVLYTTEYDRYDSARQELQPMVNTLFNKYSKAEKSLFTANHGFVKNGLIIVSKRSLKYDSRAFHEILYGVKAPPKERLWKKLKNKVLRFKLYHGLNNRKKHSTDI